MSFLVIAKKWKLEVNIEKTKVMVFHSRKCKNDVFSYNGEILENVDEFKYLGVIFTRNGKFAKCKKRLYDQASKAMFKLLQTAREQDLPLNVTLELFDKMISPILLYGSEVWGFENISLIEKLQLKFIRYLFRLNKGTMSALVYGETGKYPLEISVKVRMIRFWASLIKSNSDKFSTRMYSLLYHLHNEGDMNNDWILKIKDILVESGYDCVWETQDFSSVHSLCENVRNSLQDIFVAKWREALEGSNKCLFYRNYKHDFCQEKYISFLPDMYIIALMKFRCCNHKLAIEQGRRTGTPREERLCSCEMQTLGDELHFLLECPQYNAERLFIPRHFRTPISSYNFCRLLSLDVSKKLVLKIAKFIKHSKIT